MKKMKKLMCLLLAGIVSFGISVPSMAAAANVVSFDGVDMFSDFSNASFTGMVPGDEKTVEIELKNDADFDADWYMKNDILSALAEGREKSGGAFEYEVIYDGTVIYSSETMLDNDTANGISDNISALNDFIFLDTLAPGARKVLSLYIKVEGETQTNVYMNSLSSIRASFAATSDVGETTVTFETKYTENTTSNRVGIVKTGDDFNLQLYTILFIVSGILVLGLGVFSFYKDRKREEA